MSTEDKKAIKAKVSWVPISQEEHKKLYKHTCEWELINKRPHSVSINICAGIEAHKYRVSEKGEKIVRVDAPDGIKQCPGYQFTLRPRGLTDSRQQFSTLDEECLAQSIHLVSLLKAGHIILKKKKGKDWDNVSAQDIAKEIK